MRFSRTHTKLLSLFVVAFLCLNAGGLLCLAYCATPSQIEAAHCPLKKRAADHCNPSSKSEQALENVVFKANSVTCCIIPVSIFAAPIEKEAGQLIYPSPVAETVVGLAFATTWSTRSRQIPRSFYRPPPNDYRFQRVRNQIFRI